VIRRLVSLAVLFLAACSAAPPMPDPAPTHPASPVADEAPEQAPSQTLVMPERKPPAAAGQTRRGH
jgi:hypothetical protein